MPGDRQTVLNLAGGEEGSEERDKRGVSREGREHKAVILCLLELFIFFFHIKKLQH